MLPPGSALQLLPLPALRGEREVSGTAKTDTAFVLLALNHSLNAMDVCVAATFCLALAPAFSPQRGVPPPARRAPMWRVHRVRRTAAPARARMRGRGAGPASRKRAAETP